jgi:VCBS repeat-containing protein
LSALLVSGPAHGTLNLSPSGAFVYTPSLSYTGSDTFTYRASDGTLSSGTATVSITVLAGLVIVEPPHDQTNCVGDTVVFSVQATGQEVKYQWLLGTNVLSGQTNSTLVLSNVSGTSAASYCVIVSGANGGPFTNCAELVVNQNVIVTVPPVDQTVCRSETAQFQISAVGSDLIYRWYQGATLLVDATNSALILTNATSTQAGFYTVVVSGACGVPVTNTVSLIVNEPVVITAVPTNQVSFVGSNVTFTVNATGTALLYQWYFNGQVVGTNSSLSLSDLTTNRVGTYCVVVSGACGGPQTNCTTLEIVNRAPVANDDSYSVSQDTALVIGAPGVLGNDTDVENDALTAILVSGPAHGTLTLNADGTFTYVHDGSADLSDSFTYKLNDGLNGSNVATVSISITPTVV